MDNNTVEEVWKDVAGYEGLYKVSNQGAIFSCRQNKNMKPRLNKGYLFINLKKNKIQTTYSVHRMVANAFVENPEGKPEVNHIDENKKNNSAINLNWVTAKENSNWGTRNHRVSISHGKSKNLERVKQIDMNTGVILNTYLNAAEACRVNNFLSSSISRCLSGKTMSAYKYKWER